jgi:hypothetical protein
MSHRRLLTVALFPEKVSLPSYTSKTLGSTTTGNLYFLVLKFLRLLHLIDYGLWLHHAAIALLLLLIKRSRLCQALRRLYSLRLLILLFPSILVQAVHLFSQPGPFTSDG